MKKLENVKSNTVESVKPQVEVSAIDKIKENYGKCAIIINGQMVFRTSTRQLEKGPKSLLELYLPNYGKMRKFIVKEDGIYEIITDVKQEGTQFAQYTLGDKVEMDLAEIDFTLEKAWNFKQPKATESK